MIYSKIIGCGSYLPEKVLTNSDLESTLDTTDEWITTRTGIKKRHIISADQFTSDLAFEASKNALCTLDSAGQALVAQFVKSTSKKLFLKFVNRVFILAISLGKALIKVEGSNACKRNFHQ